MNGLDGQVQAVPHVRDIVVVEQAECLGGPLDERLCVSQFVVFGADGFPFKGRQRQLIQFGQLPA